MWWEEMGGGVFPSPPSHVMAKEGTSWEKELGPCLARERISTNLLAFAFCLDFQGRKFQSPARISGLCL